MSDFQTVLVLDDRLRTSDKITFGVLKGAMNIDQRHQPASSASQSSIQFVVQTPNLTTYISRRVLWRMTTTLKISGTPQANKVLFPYGMGCALSPFPNHQQCSTMTSVINSAATSVEIQDELPVLTKLYDERSMMAFNSLCPHYPDRFADYDDALNTNANPLGGYGNAYDDAIIPRGSFPVLFSKNQDGPFSSTYPADFAPVANPAPQTLYVRFTSIEPLMISPWTWLEKEGHGIYGVSTLNFNFTVSPSLLKRVVRYADSYLPTNLSVTYADNAFNNVYLDFNFLTAHSSLLQPSTNVIPYYNLNRQNMLTTATPIQAGQKASLVSSTITLNNIPDEVILFARKKLSDQDNTDPDFVLSIEKVNITFANKNGILANAESDELFAISKRNHVMGNWLDWSGYANLGSLQDPPKRIATAGMCWVGSFALDIPLSNDYESPSLIGQYQFQVNVDVLNQTAQNLNVELLAIFKSSGLITTTMGVSNIYQGILSMEQVLKTSVQEPYGWSDAQRLIGGSIFSTLKSNFMNFLPKIPTLVKDIAKGIDHPYAKAVTHGLEALGYGETGGRKLSKRLKKM